jgi:pSer/pThr/pTyr-binding forkhead associated (FHA) protein
MMSVESTTIHDVEEPSAELRPYLLVFAQHDARIIPLPSEGAVTIGRDREAEVHLDDVKVSRRHATLRLHGGRATVRDEGSNNGTYVDGERITGEQPLHPGAVITISGHQLVFHGGRTAGSASRARRRCAITSPTRSSARPSRSGRSG